MSGSKNLVNTVLRIPETAAKTMKEIMDIILEVAAQNRDNKMVDELVKYGKTGKALDFEVCRGFASQDFAAKLSAQNIPHAILHDTVTGLNIIATRDVDRQLVLDAKNEFFAEQNRVTLMSHPEFNRLNVGKNVEIIRGRTPTEAKIFQELAKKHGLQITAERNALDPKKVDIYYAKDKSEIANKIMFRTICATTGLTGQKAEFRVNREIAFRTNLTQDIQNDQKDFYVVSKNNPQEYIHFNKEGFQYFRNGTLIRDESRIRERFLATANSYIRNIVSPVMLQKNEFEVDKEVREKTIREIRIKTPNELRDERRDELERAARQLIEYKMSIDNGQQMQIPSSFYNNNVSFREFLSIEQINDDKEKELIETLDKLEDKEKLLVKTYIKDTFDKVENIEIQTAYIDPEMTREDIAEEINYLNNESLEFGHEEIETERE